MTKINNSDKEELVKIMGELLEPHIPALSDAFQRFGQWVENISQKHSALINNLSTIDWSAVNKRLEEMPNRSRKAMEIASRQGWFFNWEGSLQIVLTLIDNIESAGEDQIQIDEILKQHYLQYLDSYTAQLGANHPERQTAIKAAVSAHKDLGVQGYYLSIPVFLAQADGLFSEICQTSMAMSKPRNRQTNGVKGLDWVKAKIGDDAQAKDLLSPLFVLHELDLLKSEGIRNAEFEQTGVLFNALNRHQVLHGEVSDYGSEINSLKAFSFLAFVGLHLPTILASAETKQG
ncbi:MULTISPECIES: hypothetical protein [Pseudomonas]|uniref:Uncharacterized protein n=1 Tax=Pseudomonas rhodesiae TaxID=76760 RepID=A0A8I1JDE1_9PSED|nr:MULTISPECIES: hypothetical protein [Pseudomonas]MBI6603944.1 hypothetical protein [Pseudomonas sp. S4_EA_1b]MBI6624394.1 hypothetical protein [Pseudomonas rhodesiae]